MGASDSKQKEDLGNLEVSCVTFLWKIENFSKIPSHIMMKSSTFEVSTLSCYLTLYIGSFLKINFYGKDSSDDDSVLLCKISLIDEGGHQHYSNITKFPISKENDELILMLRGLSSQSKKNSLFPNDTLTIKLKVTKLSGEHKGTPGSKSSLFLETLSNDFEKFYHDGRDSDFVLKCGGKSFAVHRAILSARSTVFAAMFRHDTLDTRKKTVDITDISPSVLNNLLYYIYSAKINILTPEAADAMYRAADKYDLPALKDECLRFIKDNLTPENVSYAVILSDTFGEATLKEAIEQFVEAKLEEVLENDQWKAFSVEKPLLASAVLADAFRASKRK